MCARCYCVFKILPVQEALLAAGRRCSLCGGQLQYRRVYLGGEPPLVTRYSLLRRSLGRTLLAPYAAAQLPSTHFHYLLKLQRTQSFTGSAVNDNRRFVRRFDVLATASVKLPRPRHSFFRQHFRPPCPCPVKPVHPPRRMDARKRDIRGADVAIFTLAGPFGSYVSPRRQLDGG